MTVEWTAEAADRLYEWVKREAPGIIDAVAADIAQSDSYNSISIADALAVLLTEGGIVDVCGDCGQFHTRDQKHDH